MAPEEHREFLNEQLSVWKARLRDTHETTGLIEEQIEVWKERLLAARQTAHQIEKTIHGLTKDIQRANG